MFAFGFACVCACVCEHARLKQGDGCSERSIKCKHPFDIHHCLTHEVTTIRNAVIPTCFHRLGLMVVLSLLPRPISDRPPPRPRKAASGRKGPVHTGDNWVSWSDSDSYMYPCLCMWLCTNRLILKLTPCTSIAWNMRPPVGWPDCQNTMCTPCY